MKKELGLISVMMPAFNAERFIGQAIESVRAQTYPHWELVVVNDGSSDRTADIVTGHTDARIQLVHQPNGGEAAARNTALKHVRGEFLAFLDADDLYLPQHLMSTVGYLAAHPEYEGVYTDGYYIDMEGNRLQTLSSRRRGPFGGNLFEEAVYASDVFGPPACVVLRSREIAQHGLKFDENILIGPDWDFFTKFAEETQFGYLDKVTCEYRIHLTNVSLRMGLELRALELAKCRLNAIKLDGFRSLEEGTRYFVFYDLLVNLLRGYPERQSEVTTWSEFKVLRPAMQARLLRLMAGKSLVHGVDRDHVEGWLIQARDLNPGDWKSNAVWRMYRLSPDLLRLILRLKSIRNRDPWKIPPFAYLDSHKVAQNYT
jgi:glycosyltransferase involved in cell wall biosynthesis